MGTNFVYNPFSLLNLFDTLKFGNYWFSSGTPTFLVKKLMAANKPLDDLEGLVVEESFFERFDLETLDTEVLLFQTGYLTIKSTEMLGKRNTTN